MNSPEFFSTKNNDSPSIVARPEFPDLFFYPMQFQKFPPNSVPKQILDIVLFIRQPSVAEKKAIALVLSREEDAKRALAQCYGVLILGLGLEEAHHMHCGRCVIIVFC